MRCIFSYKLPSQALHNQINHLELWANAFVLEPETPSGDKYHTLQDSFIDKVYATLKLTKIKQCWNPQNLVYKSV